jgi:hypothetical protein
MINCFDLIEPSLRYWQRRFYYNNLRCQYLSEGSIKSKQLINLFN